MGSSQIFLSTLLKGTVLCCHCQLRLPAVMKRGNIICRCEAVKTRPKWFPNNDIKCTASKEMEVGVFKRVEVTLLS